MCYRTGRESCATNPLPPTLWSRQTHISSATTVTAINLGGAGEGLRAGHREVAVPEVPSVGSAATDIPPPAASTPTHCSPHSQQRQEEASAQRKAAQEAGPPPLPAPSLPPRGSSGADAILKPPGLCPQAGSAGTVNRWSHKDRHAGSRPQACQKMPGFS